jgi:hypothetical protein
MKNTPTNRCLAIGFGAALLTGASVFAGTFSANFNSLQFDPNDSGNIPPVANNSFLPPTGTLWGGSLRQGVAGGYDLRTGGVGGSGVLKLVNAVGSQNSSFVVQPIDMVDDGSGNLAPQKFIGFDMTFQLLLGGGNGADGFSVAVGDFAFAAGADPNTGDPVPNNAGPLFAEEGPGDIRGLTVSFDIFNNSPAGTFAEAPAIDLKWNGVIIAHRPANPAIGALPTNLQSGTAFWPVKIHLDPDGTVDVIVNNVTVFGNYPIWRDIPDPVNGLRFGFGARTGGSTVNAWMDDLNITTTVDSTPPNPAVGQPYLVSMAPALPIDQPYSALGGVNFLIQDSTYGINASTIKLLFDTTDVTAQTTITRVKSDPGLTDPDQTLITYLGNNGVLPTGAHSATLSYATTSTPAVTTSFANNFTLAPITPIPASYKVATADETKPGFKARLYQMDRWRSPGDQNITPVGERQLAFGYIDPTTHLPYPDVSNIDPSTLDPLGYFDIEGVLNFEQAGGNAGQVNGNSNPSRPESLFPGIPGNSTLDAAAGNFALEFQGYLKLKAGGYRFGVFADDRVRFSFGPSFDAVGYTPQARTTGANADTIFDVQIVEDGYYPFRCSYWEGGGGASYELYWINPANNQKVLVNDPEILEAPRAYRESSETRPWVKRVLPTETWVGAFPNEKILAEIIDGPTVGVDDSSIKMQINGVDQTITKARTGRSLLVERPGSDTDLLPSSGNTVRVIYNYTEKGATVTKTNEWFFHVAPYYNAVPLAARVPITDINTADTGFNVRYTQMDRSRDANQGNGGRIGGNGDGNRMPNPEIQLAGGEINPTNGLAYPNIAFPGPNNNFTDVVDMINFNNATVTPTGGTAQRTTPVSGFFSIPDGTLQTGNPAPLPPLPGAQDDLSAPGLPATQDEVGQGTSNNGYDNYVAEFTTYLDLKKGVHVFGMNSDDGFLCSVGLDPHDTLGTLLGFFHGGRGNKTIITDTEYAPWLNNATTALTPPVIGGQESGSSLFSVVVPEDGIYPIRLFYWNGGGGVNGEFYTVDQESGTYLLINDLSSTWLDANNTVPANRVPAYRTYTGPAREWVKFSISPNPWDNRIQQAGPGLLKMYGRTVSNVQSADIYNGQDVTPANTAIKNSGHWPDVPIGGIIANAAVNGVADASIKVLLDDVEVPATKTVNGTDVTAVYHPTQPLASGSTHKASLVYGGVTNSWPFKVLDYTPVNVADKAASSADPASRGFSVLVVQSTAARAGGSTAAAAEAQLAQAGTASDISIAGPENRRYIVPGIINYNVANNNNPAANATAGLGSFQKNVYGPGWPFGDLPDNPVPGVASAANTINFTAEIFAYLEFPSAGTYHFGASVDDGFFVKVGTPGNTNGTVLFTQDRGAGTQDFPFAIVVPEAGLYPIRLGWYQGTGGGNVEFFTYDDVESGLKIPVNDANNPKAIKAYYKLQSTTGATLSVSQANGNIVITWTGGGELQSATDLFGAWTGTGDTDGSYTEAIPATGGAKFYRVKN